MEKIIIFGASAGSHVLYSVIAQDPAYQVVAFTVDRAYQQAESFCGLPVLPFEEIENIYPPDKYKILIAILGHRTNRTRAEKYQQVKSKGYECIRYISPSASVSADLQLGENCFISDHVICRPGVVIGNNVMVMSGALIGLGTTIADHAYLAVRATLLGENAIGEYAFIGANSTILEGVTVARECILGAGSVLHEDTKEKGVYRVTPPTLLPITSDRLANILFRKTR